MQTRLVCPYNGKWLIHLNYASKPRTTVRTKERPESTRATQRTRCVRGGGGGCVLRVSRVRGNFTRSFVSRREVDCEQPLALAKNQKAGKKTRKGSKRDTREGPCILLARLSLGETRDYSQPFSQNNSSHSSRLLRRALAAESNRFGHYIFADILTLCPYSAPFQEYTASTVCYLFIRKYQEKISAVCLNLYRQELRRWIMKPLFHFVLIWVWKLYWRLDVTQRLPSVTWQHWPLRIYHRVTKTLHKIIFVIWDCLHREL